MCYCYWASTCTSNNIFVTNRCIRLSISHPINNMFVIVGYLFLFSFFHNPEPTMVRFHLTAFHLFHNLCWIKYTFVNLLLDLYLFCCFVYATKASSIHFVNIFFLSALDLNIINFGLFSIADMVLSNKVVIYDLENMAIGWTDYNCKYQAASHNVLFSTLLLMHLFLFSCPLK